MTEPTGTRPSPLRLRRVATLAELQALGPAWDRVLERSETSTPFLTREWVETWWECFGGAAEMHVLVLEDDLGVAGIAPLASSRRRLGPVAYRTLEVIGTGPLRFLGMGLADRSDLLLARRPDDCVRAVLGWLDGERRHWDLLDLRFLPAGSTTAHVLAAEAPQAGLAVRAEPLSSSPYLRLDGGWDGYLERRGRGFAKGLKRKLDRLSRLGEVKVDLDAGRRDPAAALERAAEVSLGSWKEGEGTALFLHGNVRRFFSLLAPRLAARDRLYLALLEVGGAVAAHELGYRLGGKLWSYDSAFKRPFAPGSPGVLLTARILEAAFAAGLTEYDFLRGAEGYKTEWQTETRHEVQLVVASGSARAWTARKIAFEGKWLLKRRPALLRAQERAAGLVNRWLEGGRADA